MNGRIVEVDAQRNRWMRFRQRQQLHLHAGDDFGRGGLGRYVENLDVRLLFLPSDPQADVVPLGPSAFEWLKQDRETPLRGRSPRWSYERATTDALVRFDWYRDETAWVRYLALHRYGGIEIGASDQGYEVQGTRVFSLRHIVGLVWIAAELQAAATREWDVTGPYELAIGLRNTRGAALGGFAEGWREVGQGLHSFATALDEHVLLRWELDQIEAEDLAMDAGDRLEQAFGTTNRRHFANRGEYEDRFDPRFGY